MLISALPEDPKAIELSITPRFVTIENKFGDKYSGVNKEFTSLSEFPVFDAKIKIRQEFCDKDQMQGLWDHYLEAKGRANTFYFYDYWTSMTHKQAYTLLGVGNGSQTTFDIPGRSTSNQIVYVGGIEVAATFEAGTGTAGMDRAVLVAAPADGAVVTVKFDGQRCHYGHYKKDELSRESFFDYLYSFKLQIEGLPWPV